MKKTIAVMILSLMCLPALKAQQVSLSFDGINDYVEIPNAPSIQVSGTMTLEAFIQVEAWNTTVAPYQMAIISKVNDTGWGNGWEMFVANSDGLGNGGIWIVASPGGVNAGAGFLESIPLRRWLHVAAVYDGTTFMVFVDGTRVTGESAVGSTNAIPNPLRFGRRGGAGTHNNWFAGKIESVRISNIARYTQPFIPPRVFANDAGTAGLWYMDEGSGSTILDASGNGNHGTIYGAVWVREEFVGPQPLVYLPFDGNANDESGNGNHGVVNGATPATDRFGRSSRALSFDGIDDYIQLGDLDLLGPFTLAAWVNQRSLRPDHNSSAIISKYSSGSDAAYEMLINDSHFLYGHTRVVTEGGSTITSDIEPLELNRWHFVAFAFDSDSGRLYLDGVPVKRAPMVISVDNSYGTRVGRSVWGGNQFDGVLDEIRIYGVALSDREIDTLFRAQAPVVIESPVLFSPPNGSANLPTTVLFGWNTVPVATHYRLQVSTSPSFSSLVLDDSSLNGTTRGVSNLSNATGYFWRVAGRAPSGQGPYSNIWSFNTIVAAPGAPNLSTPADGSTGLSPRLSLIWQPEPTATHYQLEVATDTGFASLVFHDSTLQATSNGIGPLEFLTTYLWRVRAKNQGGWGPYSGRWRFKTTLPAPFQTSPPDGSTGVPVDIILQWGAVPQAMNYRIQMSHDTLGQGIVLDTTLGSGTAFEARRLESSTTYYWRVRASNSEGTSEWSMWRSMTVASSGTLKVEVQNVPGWAPIGSHGTVELYNNVGSFVASQATDGSSVATFRDVSQGSGYFCKVFFDPVSVGKIFGDEYWGQSVPFNVTAADTSGVAFIRSAPYTTNITVLDLLSGLQIRGDTATLGNPLRVSLEVTNPGSPGASTRNVQGKLVLDRSKGTPYDFDLQSPGYVSMGAGTAHVFTFDVTPTAIGDYFHVAASIGDYAGIPTVTEGGEWDVSKLFTVGISTSPRHPYEYAPDGNTVLLLNMNEASGSAVGDESGYGNHGLAVGTTPVTARYLFGRELSGSGEYIDLPETASLTTSLGDQLSIEAWICMHTYPAAGQGSHIVSTGNQNDYDFSVLSDGRLASHLYLSTGPGQMDGNRVIPLNRWMHVAMTYNGSAVRYYVNGVLDTTFSRTGSVGGSPQAENLSVGAYLGDGQFKQFFDGVLDGIRVSNSARAPEEFNVVLPPRSVTAAATGLEIGLSWQNAGRITPVRYRIYRGMDSTSMALIDSVTGLSYTDRGLAPGTTYYYRLSALDGVGFEGDRSVAASGTSIAVPTIPVPMTPADRSTIASDSVLLVWRSSQPVVSRYWLDLSTDSMFAVVVIDSSIVDTSYVLRNLEHGTRYWWRIKAYNASGWGQFSQSRNFMPLRLPQAVILVSPQIGVSLQADSVRCRWESASPLADRYWAEISTDSLFTFRNLDSTVSDTSHLFTGLEARRYWWRVKAHNQAGWGPFSQLRWFQVNITDAAINENTPLIFALEQNYPNPFNPATTIRYQVPVASDVRLAVYSLLGQEVAVLVNERMAAGVYEVRLDAGSLASGVYLCRLMAGSFVETRRIVLVR